VSDIVLHRRHALPLAEAKRLAETMAKRLGDDFGGSYTWKGDRLHFRRPGVSGQVAVTPEVIEIRVGLGFLLNPWHTRIEREIVAFCDEHLDGTKARVRPQPPRPEASRRRPTNSARSRGASTSRRPQ